MHVVREPYSIRTLIIATTRTEFNARRHQVDEQHSTSHLLDFQTKSTTNGIEDQKLFLE